MKKKLGILILLCLSTMVFAQQDTNVREIVRKEFESAKGIKESQESESVFASSLFIRLSILFGASVISFGWVTSRRLKLKKKSSTNKLKENIKTLRAEKIKYEMDPRLKIVRKKLLSTVPGSQLHFETINSSAKRLNISQEEIAIAARLNMYSRKSVGGSIA